jgi:DNA-binding NarL/FixJ family response regulator
MKKSTISTGFPRCEGTLRANGAPPTKSFGRRGGTASGRAPVADLTTESRPLDLRRPGGHDSSCLGAEEQRIVDLIVRGSSNKEIAHHFSFSASTSYRRIVRILDKLGVSNKLELVLFAMSRKVVA